MTGVRELVCIMCPASCTLRVTMTAGGLGVEGNRCPRGVEYARQEVVKPLRRVMSVVKVRNGDLPTLSVITRDPVPKECIWPVMEKLASLEVEAPVEIGDVILRNVCGTDIVATRRVRRVATSV